MNTYGHMTEIFGEEMGEQRWQGDKKGSGEAWSICIVYRCEI